MVFAHYRTRAIVDFHDVSVKISIGNPKEKIYHRVNLKQIKLIHFVNWHFPKNSDTMQSKILIFFIFFMFSMAMKKLDCTLLNDNGEKVAIWCQLEWIMVSRYFKSFYFMPTTVCNQKNGPPPWQIYSILVRFQVFFKILKVTLYSHLTQNNLLLTFSSKNCLGIQWKRG